MLDPKEHKKMGRGTRKYREGLVEQSLVDPAAGLEAGIESGIGLVLHRVPLVALLALELERLQRVSSGLLLCNRNQFRG